MTTAKEILIAGLKAMGADGLCHPGVRCGCMLDDLAPGGYGCLNLEYCVAAKYFGPGDGDLLLVAENEDGYFMPVEEMQ